MATFENHTFESAPEASGEMLREAQKNYGFIPNLLKVLAESPAALHAYLGISDAFKKSSLSPTERQVVLLQASFENECHYCMAIHSGVAMQQGVPKEIVEALRNGQPIADAKLEALRTFSRKVVQDRGWVDHKEVATFLKAGYSKAQVLEVLVGVAMKTLSNYTNHIAETPVDDSVKSLTWEKPDSASAV